MNTKHVTKFILNLYNSENGLFKFSSTSNPTLLSTGFSIMTLSLLENLDKIKKEKIIEDMLKHKTSQNKFIDKLYDPSVERFHKPDYTINQFSFFTLIALDHLDYRINNLDFFHEYLDINNLRNWFKSVDWSKFWYESNKVMFWLYFYSYIEKYGNESDKEKAKECIDYSFTVLNEKQDKNTGYWGTDLNNNDLVDGCFGAAHILLFYDYFNRTIQYKEQIIDNTLSLHSKNGLILTPEGGACEDYDAVEIYLRLLKQTEYRKRDIINQIEKMYHVINRNQETDGGFPYRISLRKYGLFKQKKEDVYRYSSWEMMEARLYYSDTWATYFRLLTLAAIDNILKENNKWFHSYSLPGWGFIQK